MALDTTVSGSSSDSYVTLAEANTFFQNHKRHFDATWDALSDTQKEVHLRDATLALDALRDWRGYRPDSDQALEFPRELGEISFYKTTLYPSNTIDQKIKHAQMEVAMMVIRRGSTTDTIETRYEESIGALSGTVNIGYRQRSDQKDLETLAGNSMTRVLAYLKPWNPARRMVRA